MPLPLYGFVEGDTIGVLMLAGEQESVSSLAGRLKDEASLRVELTGDIEVVYQGTVLDPAITVSQAGFAPLQRFDLRRKHGVSESRDGR
jgi:hypothetical protein